MNPRNRRAVAFCSVAAVVSVTACSDLQQPEAPPVADQMITCTANVQTRSLRCDAPTVQPTPGLALSVTLGGQGTYVQLASSNVSYNSATTTFSADVTVKNLTAQPMGTADGSNPDANGVRVFFHSGPTVTNGTGTVTVSNADGTGTFTGTNQPYFQYAGPLAPNATSAAKTWRWSVPVTVNTFTFEVLIQTILPQDQGVLRWVPVSSPTTRRLNALEMAGQAGTGYAFGDSGTVLYYDGSAWSLVNTGLPLGNINLYDVADSGDTLWVVGDSGKIVFFNGSSWSLQTSGVTTALFAIDKVGGTHSLFAVGVGGVILFSANGTTWSPQTSGVTDTLFVTGGPAANNWFAAGQGGTALHWDGSTWSSLATNTTASLHGGTGAGDSTGLTDIWLVGTGGTIVHSSNGAVWSAQTSPTAENLFSIDARSATSAIAAGSAGTIIQWNGIAWSAMWSGSSANLKAIQCVEVLPISCWAVGAGGVILHGIR